MQLQLPVCVLYYCQKKGIGQHAVIYSNKQVLKTHVPRPRRGSILSVGHKHTDGDAVQAIQCTRMHTCV
jgi:hypothetical protein